MGRMPGRRKGVQPEDVSFGHVDVRRRDGGKLAPERVERLSVEAPGARFQPRGVDEMWSADLRHVHL
jgi:hypothetical protein